MTIPDLEPAAFITERLDGTKRSVMLIEKYDPRKPEFWANEEARAQHRVIPLYAARSAPEAGKAVAKPLEWDHRNAETPFGCYTLSQLPPDANETLLTFNRDLVGAFKFPSIEAAKAAAQQDFEQRVLSALASYPAPTGEIAGLVNAIISRLIYPVSTEINPRGWEFRETSMLEEAVRYIKNEAAAALTASEAEAADLRRKLEEHQDAEDKAAREMATVIQSLRNRATAAERKLEEARKALEPFAKVIETAEQAGTHFGADHRSQVPDDRPYLSIDSAVTWGDFRRAARTLSGASQ